MRDVMSAIGVSLGQIACYFTGVDLQACIAMATGAWLVVILSRFDFSLHWKNPEWK
jgi:hypothetical protein